MSMISETSKLSGQVDEGEDSKLLQVQLKNTQQMIKSNMYMVRGIIFITIILFAIIAYLFSELRFVEQNEERINSNWQNQINQFKKEGQQLRTKLKEDKQTQGILMTALRGSQSERFYLDKIEKIRKIANQPNFLKGNEKARISFLLAMNNYKLTHQNVFLNKQINDNLQKQYERLSQKYDFQLPEEPFCVVVPTINNVQNFRYEYNLRSIFNQNYSNYKVVIVDDASPDHNYDVIAQFLKDNPVHQSVFLMKNEKRESALHNIYKGITSHCQPEDIALLVDGDDELLGVNVFKVFNSLYTTKKLEVLYSNFITFKSYSAVGHGISEPYSETQKKRSLYRSFHYTRMFPTRSFRVRNFLKIRVSDLQDDQGKFYRSASDQAICTPLLELSCGLNMYLEQYFYLYNTNIGNNDLDVDQQLNRYVTNQIRYVKKKYECQDIRTV